MGGAITKVNHIIKQSHNIGEHYLTLRRRVGQSIEEDKISKSENLLF